MGAIAPVTEPDATPVVLLPPSVPPEVEPVVDGADTLGDVAPEDGADTLGELAPEDVPTFPVVLDALAGGLAALARATIVVARLCAANTIDFAFFFARTVAEETIDWPADCACLTMAVA